MQLACVGDNITDVYVEHQMMFPGGNCVNVAVHGRRAGMSCSYVGRVGQDVRGTRTRQALASEGVDTHRLLACDGITGYAEIHHSASDRVFGAYDRGVAPFTPQHEDLALAARAEVVHTSYSSNLTEWLPTLSQLAKVSYDFDDHVDDGYADALLPHVHYAFFSGSHLDDEQVHELLSWAVSRGPTVAAATLGSRGAAISDGQVTVLAPAPDIELVDTLGAGDAFIGTFLAGSIKGLSLGEATRRAVTVATATCAHLGGFGHGSPSETERRPHHISHHPRQGVLP